MLPRCTWYLLQKGSSTYSRLTSTSSTDSNFLLVSITDLLPPVERWMSVVPDRAVDFGLGFPSNVLAAEEEQDAPAEGVRRRLPEKMKSDLFTRPWL